MSDFSMYTQTCVVNICMNTHALSLTLQAFYNQIDSVTEFQTGETCVATLANFEAIAGERRYLIAFGNHLDKDHIPQLKSLSHVDISSAAAMIFSSSILYLSMLISTLLT